MSLYVHSYCTYIYFLCYDMEIEIAHLDFQLGGS